MIRVESQLHGYSQGHELLAASIQLPKADQSIVDRLSDIAGPLRSGETFAPYISGYPLPSGTHYVLARTWQDLTVQRAGCVRTLSLLIPMDIWSTALSIKPFFDLLQMSDFPSQAQNFIIAELLQQPLPLVSNFEGNELVEAIFLEDSRPVAVIDAVNTELIVLRLLTALWSSIRKRFSVSTFALSPRRIDGRDFDLVFIPKSARSKFADWHGRRIDGQATSADRHRWTSTIVERIFGSPTPRLLNERDIGVVGEHEADPGAALRIALLWSDLLVKLESSPFALLGLLDIFNSRKQGDANALHSLKSHLGSATHRAVNTLPDVEAWQFIGAITRKAFGTPLADELGTVASAAGFLSSISPGGAISLLNQQDFNGAIDQLLPEIAQGIGKDFSVKTEEALLSALPNTLIRLAMHGEDWIGIALSRPSIIQYFTDILVSSSSVEKLDLKKFILPYVLDNNQVKLAELFFKMLSSEELLQEVSYLAKTNKFSAISFISPLVERAFELGIIQPLRSLLISLDDFSNRDKFIFETLSVCVQDFYWLLSESKLGIKKLREFTFNLLRNADADQKNEVLNQENLCCRIYDLVDNDAIDILMELFERGQLPIYLYMDASIRLIDFVEGDSKVKIAFDALSRGLCNQFSGNQLGVISILLEVVGNVLNGGWVVQVGLDSLLDQEIYNRNLIAFNQASEKARLKIVESVDYLAETISKRYALDISPEASDALTEVLIDSRAANNEALIYASGRLLPLLFRSTQYPVSSVLTVAFPIVYQQLANHDHVPDVLRFIPFFDWDKCKAARIELAEAFIGSNIWAPEDFLIIGCLCQDEEKIIKHLRRSFNGGLYIQKLRDCLPRVPYQFQKRAVAVLTDISKQY